MINIKNNNIRRVSKAIFSINFKNIKRNNNNKIFVKSLNNIKYNFLKLVNMC